MNKEADQAESTHAQHAYTQIGGALPVSERPIGTDADGSGIAATRVLPHSSDIIPSRPRAWPDLSIDRHDLCVRATFGNGLSLNTVHRKAASSRLSARRGRGMVDEGDDDAALDDTAASWPSPPVDGECAMGVGLSEGHGNDKRKGKEGMNEWRPIAMHARRPLEWVWFVCFAIKPCNVKQSQKKYMQVFSDCLHGWMADGWVKKGSKQSSHVHDLLSLKKTLATEFFYCLFNLLVVCDRLSGLLGCVHGLCAAAVHRCAAVPLRRRASATDEELTLHTAALHSARRSHAPTQVEPVDRWDTDDDGRQQRRTTPLTVDHRRHWSVTPTGPRIDAHGAADARRNTITGVRRNMHDDQLRWTAMW